MMIDVCHHACNEACTNFLRYSTGICASAVQILPEGEDLRSQTTTTEGDRKDKAKHKCMLCRSKQTWERADHTSLHQSFMVIPS